MNKKVKILLSFLALATAVVYFAITSSFIAKKEHEQRCRGFSIEVSEADERAFVTQDDIRSILLNSSQPILSEPIHAINIYKTEELLLSKSYIKNAEVFVDIDGTLNIYIKQRKPIIRINTQGSGFYIDENSFVFPLSRTYTEYVPLVTGNPPLPFPIGYKGLVPDKGSAGFIKKLYAFALFLKNNSYWNSMVEQIHVVSENNVELITRVGSHVVMLGSFDDFEYKLHKLDNFYRKGMPAVGWNKYKTVNLAYGNQVICK